MGVPKLTIRRVRRLNWHIPAQVNFRGLRILVTVNFAGRHWPLHMRRGMHAPCQGRRSQAQRAEAQSQ